MSENNGECVGKVNKNDLCPIRNAKKMNKQQNKPAFIVGGNSNGKFQMKKIIEKKQRTGFIALATLAVILEFGVLTGFAQSYLFTGSETTINLNAGIYNIIVYGAQGGGSGRGSSVGGLGAEMGGEFYFSGTTTLTLLVGGTGGTGGVNNSGGGGGGSFVVAGSIPLLIAGGGGGASYYGGGAGSTGTSGSGGGATFAGSGGSNGSGGGGGDSINYGGGGGGGYNSDGGGGGYTGGGGSFLNGAGGGGGPVGGGYGGGAGGYGGGGGGGGYSGGGGGGWNGGGGGGGSYIDASAIATLIEISGIASPDGSPNGEIFITAVPEPTTFSLLAFSGSAGLFLLRRKVMFNR